MVIQRKPSHWPTLLMAAGTETNLTTDAHTAALAITHDAAAVGCDRDFRRFDGLRVVDPAS